MLRKVACPETLSCCTGCCNCCTNCQGSTVLQNSKIWTLRPFLPPTMPRLRKRARGRTKNYPPGSDGDGQYASLPVTQPTGSSSNQQGKNQNQGGSSPQHVPTSTVNTNLPMLENCLLAEIHNSQPPPEDGVIHCHQGKHETTGFSPLQTCSICEVNTGQSSKSSDLGVDIGCSHQAPFFKLLQEVSSCGSHDLTAPQKVLRWAEEILLNRDMLLRRLEEHRKFVAKEHQVELANLKHEYDSSHEAELLVLQNENAVLRKGLEDLLAENQAVEEENEARNESFHELQRLFKEDIAQKQSKILSLERLNELQNLELQKISYEHGLTMVIRDPGPEYGHEQLNALCGSYSDASGTPLLLHTALCIAKNAVTKFQKEFFDVMRSIRQDPRGPYVFFARPNHVSYHVKSVVYDVLFEGFENESFNTLFGVTRYLDPNLRQEKFYEYYLREREKGQAGDSDDPQFEEFYEEKSNCLWVHYLKDEKESTEAGCLQEIGDKSLTSTFRAAARSVWLLHKLAFSFEPPASIFRVEYGADVDPNYMDTVVSLEDNDRFVPKVGFMIAPGLRLRNTVIRCEVYLAGAIPIPD